MDAVYSVGLAGMALIVTGWFISLDTVPSPKLSGLYGLGSTLLAVYAYLLGDPVFLTLNVLAAIVSLYNFQRAVRSRPHRTAGASKALPSPAPGTRARRVARRAILSV